MREHGNLRHPAVSSHQHVLPRDCLAEVRFSPRVLKSLVTRESLLRVLLHQMADEVFG